MADEQSIRPGTGKVLKFFRGPGESMTQLKDEIAELTDTDLKQLVGGIEDGSLTY
jgi:hypothetical protein